MIRNAKNYKLAVQHLERYIGTNRVMFLNIARIVVDFGGIDFVYGDGTELEKLAVAYLALEYNLTGYHVGAVDIAENGDVLRAVFERKGYSRLSR